MVREVREMVREDAHAFVNFETVSNISIYDKSLFFSVFQNMIY